MADQMKLRKQIQACRELDCGTIEDIAFTGISGVSCSIVGKMNSNRALNENSITFLGEVQASHESKKAGNTVEAMTTMFNMLQQVMSRLKTLAISIFCKINSNFL